MDKFYIVFFLSIVRKISPYHLPSYAASMKTYFAKRLPKDYHRQRWAQMFWGNVSVKRSLSSRMHPKRLFFPRFLLLIVTSMSRMIACQDYSSLAAAHCSKTERPYTARIQSKGTFRTAGVGNVAALSACTSVRPCARGITAGIRRGVGWCMSGRPVLDGVCWGVQCWMVRVGVSRCGVWTFSTLCIIPQRSGRLA